MKTVAEYIESGMFETCGEANRRLKRPITTLLLATNRRMREVFTEDGEAFFYALMASIPETLIREAEEQLHHMKFPFGEENPFTTTLEDVREAIEKVRQFMGGR